MKSYTSSEARQNFATVLEVVIPEQPTTSPLAIAGITLSPPITRDDILAGIQDGRQRHE